MNEQQPRPENEKKPENENSLLPELGLEVVEGREFISENVAISGRKFVRSSFNFCNLIYNGGPVNLEECGGTNNRLIEMGPIKDALNRLPHDEIIGKMIHNWRQVRLGLHQDIPEF